MEYYSAIKKTEIIPFAATWIEMIMLSEVNQIKQISQDTTYIWNLKNMIQMNLFTKQNRLTDIENKLMVYEGLAKWH